MDEFWISNHSWDWGRLTEYLPVDALQLIEARLVIQGDECMDCLYWNGTLSRGFTIKFSMKNFRLQDKTPYDKAWHIA